MATRVVPLAIERNRGARMWIKGSECQQNRTLSGFVFSDEAGHMLLNFERLRIFDGSEIANMGFK